RETVLNFFEQLQKHFPTLQNFYSREPGEYVLEGKKENGAYRWATVEPKRVCAGYVNPSSLEAAITQNRTIAELLPYFLSISPIDCESFNIMFGFDFTYRGNHNALVAEALGVPAAFEKLTEYPSNNMINYEPSFQFAFDDKCQTQIRLKIETRTGALQVKTGDYGEEQFSVFLTASHIGSLPPGSTYVNIYTDLLNQCQELMDHYVIENVLVPLQQAIAIK
ncbi:MAG: hypothetical protein VX438_14910, partial [Planctomycetota bacterium]|nr:hypothetical protein [Planctomycetota bacterium]